MIRAVILILLTALAGVDLASAQIPIDFDLGVRGGAFNSGIPMSVDNNHYFPNIYTTDNPPFTAGVTFGALLNDRWQVRFEVVRSRFGFHEQLGTNFNFPYSLTESTSTTEGHVWQYPLLLTYVAGTGPIRPFAGGGMSFASTFRGTTQTLRTNVVGPLPPPGSTAPVSTVTTTSTAPFRLTGGVANPIPFYITGGLDSRIRSLSIRPELRYTHWTSFDARSLGGYDDTILFSANQFEFLVSVTVHPLRHHR